MKFMHPTAPQFLQAASNIVVPAVELVYSEANPSIKEITTDGAVVVKSIYNRQPKFVEYPNGLSAATLSIDADANTTISICGKVTSFVLSKYNTGTEKIVSFSARKQNKLTSLDLDNGMGGIGAGFVSLDIRGCVALTSLNCTGCSGLTSLNLSANTALTSLSCDRCSGLTSLDLSANTALTSLSCDRCSGLTSLDLSANTALTSLRCNECSGLTSLDLSANTALTSLECSTCPGLTFVKFRANNQVASLRIANAITAADSTTGTVYLNSSDTYYSTVANAATAKGWTIEAL